MVCSVSHEFSLKIFKLLGTWESEKKKHGGFLPSFFQGQTP